MEQPSIERAYRKRKANFIKVMAFDVVTENQVRELKVDFSKEGKQKWLFDFVLWATSNGLSVEIEKVV